MAVVIGCVVYYGTISNGTALHDIIGIMPMGAKITGHATAAPARQCHTGAQVHTREPGYSRTCAAAILTIDADGAWPRLYERGRVGKTIPGIPTSNADLPCGRRFILQWGSYLHKYQPKHLEPKIS